MNKIHVSIIILALFMAGFNTSAYATSGACSSHDGVDCSAGSDWDGSVICNDGWRDSSVSYSSMSECSGSSNSDLDYELYLWETVEKQDCINWIKENEDLLTGDDDPLPEGWGGLNSTQIERLNDIQENGLGSLLEGYVMTLLDTTQKTYLQICEPYYELEGSKLLLKDDVDVASNVTPTQLCQNSYGENSYSVGDQNTNGTYNCYCNDGYELNSSGTECVASNTTNTNHYSTTEICEEWYGPRAEVTSEDYCDCEDGFALNSRHTACVKDIEGLENPFSDVFDLNKNYDAILYLYNQGIINGYEGNVFKPYDEINRAELTKILVESKGLTPDISTYNNCFTDVKDEWFAPYVCYAKEQGWIDGYSDGKFNPLQTVIKVESIKILLNALGINISSDISEKPFDDIELGMWYTPFVYEAKQRWILEEQGSLFEGTEKVTRGGFCENLFRLLTF